MAKIIESCVIYIDTNTKTVHYYSTVDGDKSRVSHDIKTIKGRLFSEEYYANLATELKVCVERYSPAGPPNGTIILPDTAVFSNTTSFPSLKGTDLNKTVDAFLNNQYRNIRDLKIDRSIAVSNKNFVTFNFVGVMSNLVTDLKRACTDAGINVQDVSFASCATQAGFQSIATKEKSSNYLFLDIKENFARMTYVFRGRVVGYYSLPFGLSILNPDKIAAEDVLLYRPVAELAVVNAKEKAKQKALTLSGQTNVTDQAGNLSEDGEEEENDENNLMKDNLELNVSSGNLIKTLPRKVARKLPKFMQREIPQDEELRVYENFRIFEKWVLDIIEGSDKLTSLGNLDYVIVNMPQELDFIFEIVNQYEEENKVKFVTAGLYKEKDDISRNLEMFGGFFLRSNPNTIKF